MPSQNIMLSLYLAVCQSVHHARRLAPCATLPMALASVEPGRNIATQGHVARPAGGHLGALRTAYMRTPGRINPGRSTSCPTLSSPPARGSARRHGVARWLALCALLPRSVV
jgi:hypothetical protein